MRESYLVNDLIRAAYPFMRLWRINTGSVMTRDGRRFTTGTPKGFPDLFGVLPADQSRFGCAVPVFIEAKVKPNKPTPEQVKFIDDMKAQGAVAGVCYSVDDFWELMIPALKSPNKE